MNFDTTRRWNEVVQPGDHVWYLGDFAMGDYKIWPKYLAALNGRIAFVSGNHDKGAQTMLDIGFIEVHDNVVVEVDGYRLWLNHFPPQAAVEPEFRRDSAIGSIRRASSRRAGSPQIARFMGRVQQSPSKS